MIRRTIAVCLGVFMAVAALSGCGQDTPNTSEGASLPPADIGQIALDAANEFAGGIIADLKAEKEPAESEYNEGVAVLRAYKLFAKTDTLTAKNLELTQTPPDPKDDHFMFNCDISGESVKAGGQFEDEICIYVKVDPDTKKVEKTDWFSWHCSDVYFSDKNLKAFFDCAAKDDPKSFCMLYMEGTDEPPDNDYIARTGKNMKYYTDKYDLSSFSMVPVDVSVSVNDDFFIKYEITDAKKKVFEMTMQTGDGMVYPVMPIKD